jgi:hypothetical protein
MLTLLTSHVARHTHFFARLGSMRSFFVAIQNEYYHNRKSVDKQTDLSLEEEDKFNLLSSTFTFQ